MKIKVFAPPFLDGTSIDEHGWLELAEGGTLKDVYKLLRVPLALRPLLLCSVNYQKPSRNMRLKADDVVSIYFPLAGG